MRADALPVRTSEQRDVPADVVAESRNDRPWRKHRNAGYGQHWAGSLVSECARSDRADRESGEQSERHPVFGWRFEDLLLPGELLLGSRSPGNDRNGTESLAR